MEYNELINGFAAKFAVEGLEMQDGAAAFEIDGMTVVFINDPQADTITVLADIGHPPPDANGPFGAAMLKANYLFGGTDGATLCQNPDTEAYAVMQSWPLAEHDVTTLSAAVERLVNTAERWRDVLNGIREAERASEDMDGNDGRNSPARGDFQSDGFIQV